MDSLKYSNYALLICNKALSLTCCDQEVALYWDAVPCSLESNYRYDCDEVNQCSFGERKYITTDTTCAGNQVNICECQRITFNNKHEISESAVSDIFEIEYDPNTPDNGTITWTNDDITIEDTDNGIIVISNTGTLEQTFDYITSIPNWTGTWNALIDKDLPATIVETGAKVFTPISTQSYDSIDSRFKLKLGLLETSYITYASDTGTLRSNIESALESLTGYTNAIEVVINSGLSDGTKTVFDIAFTGVQCGINQNGVSGSLLNLNYTDGYYEISEPSYRYAISGEYGNDRPFTSTREYLDDNRYLRIGSGDFTEEVYYNICPYGVTRLYDDYLALGPYPYDETQCCPQKGLTFGPEQSIRQQIDETYGYNRNENYSNLENTVVINNACYKLDPFFFLFGRNGRFKRSHETVRTPLIVADCDYSIQPNSPCDSELPCNCVVDLFLAQFSQNIPWGPFGSYFHNIESTPHPATADESSYIGANYPDRAGIDYAPRGSIKTYGTWLETKEIRISFSFHRAVPFWMGSDEHDDLNLLGTLDTSTIDPAFTYDEGTGCGLATLIYDCEGKTVGDFITAINAIKSEPTEINPEGCFIFAFCPSSDDVNDIPISKIINTSAELYDLSEIFGVSDGTYDADIDDDKLSGSDIFGSPRPYSKYWPKTSSTNIDIIGGASSDTDGVYRRLFNGGTTDNPMAKYPPYCRLRAIGLPKSTDNTATRPSRLFAGPNFTDSFGFKSPWWQAIQGCNTNVVNLVSGSGLFGPLPSYITKIQTSVTDRVLNVVVNSGSTEIFNENITTIKNSGYKVTDFVREINDFGLVYGTDVFWPITASSGVSEYDIWLDDKTYWDSSTHEPLQSGDVGAIETPYNLGYIEPLLDADPINLITTSNQDLYSYVRRRCDYGSESQQYLPPLTGCVPYHATKYSTNDNLDCGSDSYFEDTNFLLTYGCSSHVCKTEWYLKSTRCGCSVEWLCTTDSGRYTAHKFNREGTDNQNKTDSWSDYFAVNQPDLYICEYAIHSQCDIPFMIKVPYQIWGDVNTFPTNSQGIGFECGQSDIAIVYADGSHAQAEGEYLGSGPACDENGVLNTYSIGPSIRFLAECEGWCQYIDPVIAVRVKKENIPRTWPPSAYVAERGYPVFCSVNPYSESIDNICNGEPPQYDWDSIYGVMPVVPAKYLRSDGYPCSIYPNYYNNGIYGLRVLTRPIINPLTFGELCGIENDARIDIGCATKCCGCFFDCAPDDSTLKYGPYACPCYQTFEFNQTVSVEGIPFLCSFIHRGGMSSIQPCNQCITYGGGGPSQPNIYGGTYDVSYSINFEFTVDICCRTCPVPFSTDKTYTFSKNVTGCTGDYYDECVGTPSVTPPDIVCSADSICEANPVEVLNCSDALSLLYTTHTSEVHTSSSSANQRENYPCGDNCSYNLCGRFTDIDQNIDVYVTEGECSNTSRNWLITTDVIGQGISLHDGVSLGYSNDGGSNLFQFTMTTTDSGNIDISEKTCQNCPVGLTLSDTAKTLPYVTGWLSSINWNCGEPNITKIYTETDAGIQYDPECV